MNESNKYMVSAYKDCKTFDSVINCQLKLKEYAEINGFDKGVAPLLEELNKIESEY